MGTRGQGQGKLNLNEEIVLDIAGLGLDTTLRVVSKVR